MVLADVADKLLAKIGARPADRGVSEQHTREERVSSTHMPACPPSSFQCANTLAAVLILFSTSLKSSSFPFCNLLIPPSSSSLSSSPSSSERAASSSSIVASIWPAIGSGSGRAGLRPAGRGESSSESSESSEL